MKSWFTQFVEAKLFQQSELETQSLGNVTEMRRVLLKWITNLKLELKKQTGKA